MPRTKRVKRASTPNEPAPAPPRSLSPESQEPQTPSPAPTESIDPALLDEEEAPSTLTSSSKKPFAGPGGFNALKSFHGQVYTGMAVGGSHTWNYEAGVWRETKEEPDLWSIDWSANKRRARRAPEGSGAGVGTEYHWFVVAHQYVKKIDANTYETHMTGSKYKLAHKNATSGSWSVPTVKGQRERELELLEDAKRRVQGRPPVHAGEKVRVERREKGQQSLDSMFMKTKGREEGNGKRKREGDDGG